MLQNLYLIEYADRDSLVSMTSPLRASAVSQTDYTIASVPGQARQDEEAHLRWRDSEDQVDVLILKHRRHPLGGGQRLDAGDGGFDGQRAQRIGAMGQSLSIKTRQDVVNVIQSLFKRLVLRLDPRFSLGAALTAPRGTAGGAGTEHDDRPDLFARAEVIQSREELGANLLVLCLAPLACHVRTMVAIG